MTVKKIIEILEKLPKERKVKHMEYFNPSMLLFGNEKFELTFESEYTSRNLLDK